MIDSLGLSQEEISLLRHARQKGVEPACRYILGLTKPSWKSLKQTSPFSAFVGILGGSAKKVDAYTQAQSKAALVSLLESKRFSTKDLALIAAHAYNIYRKHREASGAGTKSSPNGTTP